MGRGGGLVHGQGLNTHPPSSNRASHCQNGRQLQGSDYSRWVVVADAQFNVESGSESIENYSFGKGSQKSFCRHCGSTRFGINGKHFQYSVVIPLGNVNNYCDAIQPQVQVYSTDRAPWVSLCESVSAG